MMVPLQVSLPAMAAQSRGSVKVLVQPDNDSFDAIATPAFSSRSVSTWKRGNPAARSRPLGAAMVAVLAFGHEQLGEEPAVAELVPFGFVSGLGEPGPDGGQAQHGDVDEQHPPPTSRRLGPAGLGHCRAR